METAGKIAEDVVDKFKQEWEPLMENVKEAAETFDNLEGNPAPTVILTPWEISTLSCGTSCHRTLVISHTYQYSALHKGKNCLGRILLRSDSCQA